MTRANGPDNDTTPGQEPSPNNVGSVNTAGARSPNHARQTRSSVVSPPEPSRSLSNADPAGTRSSSPQLPSSYTSSTDSSRASIETQSTVSVSTSDSQQLSNSSSAEFTPSTSTPQPNTANNNNLSAGPRSGNISHREQSNSSRDKTLTKSDSSKSESEDSPEPPVTRQTLVELDVNKIVLNSRLRHDINFDPELHFRPNMDGDKGRKKNQKAEQFWLLLTDQLILFMTNRGDFERKWPQSSSWCLPNLLKAVKEIIQSLVPSRDRQSLEDTFNVEFLMQQFTHGSLDLERLASWLGSLLKSHCAPMRDDWVDEMYRQLSEGNKNSDIILLVKGLRNLLSVLEAMKLDVANHQIRCLRPSLIEDTVKFERRYFEKKMLSDRLDTTSAQHWFRTVFFSACRLAPRLSAELQSHVKALGDLAVVALGMAQLTMPGLFHFRFPLSHNHHHPQAMFTMPNGTTMTTIPPTFMHDEERIFKMREEVNEMIALAHAMKVYDQELHLYNATHRESAMSFNIPSYIASPGDPSFEEPVSRSNDNSPRSSRSFGSAPTSSQSPAQARDEVYRRLVDLLRNVPPSSSNRRGQSRLDYVIPMWVMEITRNFEVPSERILELQETLSANLANLQVSETRNLQINIFSMLLQEILPRLRDFRGMKAWNLYTHGTSGRPYTPTRPGAATSLQTEVSPLRLLATKIAHVSTLHHQVWGQLYAGVNRGVIPPIVAPGTGPHPDAAAAAAAWTTPSAWRSQWAAQVTSIATAPCSDVRSILPGVSSSWAPPAEAPAESTEVEAQSSEASAVSSSMSEDKNSEEQTNGDVTMN